MWVQTVCKVISSMHGSRKFCQWGSNVDGGFFSVYEGWVPGRFK